LYQTFVSCHAITDTVLRLVLLLLGTPFARRFSGLLCVVGLALGGVGAVTFLDTLDGVLRFPVRAFGMALLGFGAVTLLGAAMNDGVRMRLRLARALLFIGLGYVLTDKGHLDDVVVAVLFGAAIALDGVFRIVAAAMLRFSGWSAFMLVGVVELLLAALIVEPGPMHHRGTVSLCLGAILLLGGFVCLRIGVRLLRLGTSHSLPLLFSRGDLPDTEKALRFEAPEPQQGVLTMHVWTPAGVLENPTRRPILDRYVAAVDEHGVVSTGHCAIEGPTLYISHYPGVEIDRDPENFAEALRATVDNDVPARYLPDYASEAAGWCESTVQVQFARTDVGRVRAFWEHYKVEQTYNLTRRNCAISAVMALEVGLEGQLVRDGFSFSQVFRLAFSPELWVAGQLRMRAEAATWTPGLVADYARALFGALSTSQQTWREKFRSALSLRDRIATRDAERTAQVHRLAERALRSANENAPAKTTKTFSLAAVVATATIFGLTYGLSAPLLAQTLESSGKGKLFIGLNAAMHAVGVLGVAPFLPKLAARWGSRRLIMASLLATALLLPMFVIVPSVWLWFPIRFGLGVAAEILLVLSEAWANQMSDTKSRGRTMAIYTAALSVGYAGGPAILSVLGAGNVSFLVGAGIAAVALLPLLHPRVEAPAGLDHPSGNPLKYLTLAPLAMGVALVNAAVESAGLTFVPMYATGIGYTEGMALKLITTLMVGAIVLQLPIGYLADKVSARRLVLILSVVTAIGAALWPLLLPKPALAFATVFVWGGLFVGIYTVMLTSLGKRFQGGELIGIYSMMSVAWGLGALVGPSTVGAAMTWSPRFGLPATIATACALLALSVLTQRKRNQSAKTTN
jgi:MFS family permease/uncharacterized membrane protein HdeD (DUF308 family)